MPLYSSMPFLADRLLSRESPLGRCPNALIMPRFTIFMDVAGRVSKETKGYESISVSAVALHTSQLPILRNELALLNLPKWKDCSPIHLNRIYSFLDTHHLFCAAICINKLTSAWSNFWDRANQWHDHVASVHRMKTGYLKAANIIKYWVFGQCSSLLIANLIQKFPPILLDSRGLGVVDIFPVCDSDIQGQENIDVFKDCWDKFNQHQHKVNKLGINVFIRGLDIKTEQDEPLLLLPDYLCGMVHVIYGVGSPAIPSSVSHTHIQKYISTLSSNQTLSIREIDFNLSYADIIPDSISLP